MTDPEEAVVRLIYAADEILKTTLPCVEGGVLPKEVLRALAELAMAQLEVVKTFGPDGPGGTMGALD